MYERHPKIKPLAGKLDALSTELRAARRVLKRLEAEHGEVVRADRQATADARRAGKEPPGDDAIRAHLDKIAAQRREVESLEVAVRDQRVDVEAAVDKHRPEWLQQATEAIETAHDRFQAVVDELAAAHAALGDAYSLYDWLRGEHHGPRAFLGRVESLRTPAGEPQPWSAVEQALRAMAEPPRPERSRDQRTWNEHGHLPPTGASDQEEIARRLHSPAGVEATQEPA